ncbi:MAG: HEAT repeat domain-containing protein [Gemmataceae bacterium]|nr:HEAT repeat domain-containing protein [Gemmataceae bacterium]MDW8266224.1 HEAT repeat domain-containing protein [Gemmataceae bacterium]
MTAIFSVGLGLAALLPSQSAAPPPAVAGDLPRLREMLHDRQHPLGQSQAAMVLVQDPSPDAQEIVRHGLKQSEAPEIFLALASAIRFTRDRRFDKELLTGLVAGRPAVRQAAAETLAVIADTGLVQQLATIAADPRHDIPVRLATLWTLGRSGQKAAFVPLLEQLRDGNETLQRAAADALSDLTGLPYGTDAARWSTWWASRKDLPNERWLEDRLAYQRSRIRRLEGDLERARAQIVRLHQQLYARLPAGDRLGHIQTLVDHEDAAIRALAVSWCSELLPVTDGIGQRLLAEALLRLSRDSDPEVQRPAVLALGRLQDERAFHHLKLVLQHGSPPIRAAAAHALAQLASGPGPAAQAMLPQVVPLLQKALDDPALEVVVAAAEDLGNLGVPEAGPVLTALLRHPSEPVRQTAALALERAADPSILDSLLAALEDPAVAVRFSLVGALGRAAGDGQALSDPQRARLFARLEDLLLRDADAGVRSRAATVLGQCGTPPEAAFLFRRIQSREDPRVQEKGWEALIQIVVRSQNVELVRDWDRTLAQARLGPRRLQLLSEVHAQWRKNNATLSHLTTVTEALVQAQLDEGKWAPALPLIRELLNRPGGEVEIDRRLRWLLAAGELALQEGNRPEALQVAQDAQPFLPRRPGLAGAFERLEKQARRSD